jgi:uncharacterized membrane protein
MRTLQQKIMRRVYYAYALRTITEPAIVHGFLMLAMLIALTYFVSIGNVIENLLNIKVRNLDTFLYSAVTNTEAWTLLILGGFIFSLFSLRFSVSSKRPLQFAKV